MNILITGGAGYIGSNTAYKFLDDGHQVTIIDNLSTGNKKLIPKKSKFYKLDISSNKVDKILKQNAFDAVVHFAAFISVEESEKKPIKYNHNNYKKTLCFLKFCIKNNVKNIIFSSTAAVYGNKFTKPVSENQKLKPTNPYAKSKKKVEDFLIKQNRLNYIILRYFNVAGSDFKLRTGQISKYRSTHLIKRLCEFALNQKKLSIYGSDYPSKDGTAIRDYIHVEDLARAHILASKYVLKKKANLILNCGNGVGYTVLNIVKQFNKVSDNYVNYKFKSRRRGDVFKLVAKIDRIKKFLKFTPRYKNLDSILKSHYDWEQKLKKNV